MIKPCINLAVFTAIFTAMLHLVGCSDGLVYGERTSFSLASIRINDDPAQPVSVKIGFNRDVVLVAPPIGGVVDDNGEATPSGEAVSQFSTFTLSSTTPFVTAGQTSPQDQEADLLGIQTRFASGEAALAIAGKPKIVAAVLGRVSGNPVTGAMVEELAKDRRKLMFESIDTIDGNRAKALAVVPPTPLNAAMQNVVSAVDPNNVRGTNEVAARRVLRALVPELRVSSYAAWESALGI